MGRRDRPKGAKAADIRQLTSDLLQSPVVYLNGHTLHLSDREIELLKEYLNNGGFLLAEACCGDARFKDKFAELAKELVPGGTLKELGRDHPIWTASGKFAVPPGRVPLMGIERGCKTVAVFSPRRRICVNVPRAWPVVTHGIAAGIRAI